MMDLQQLTPTHLDALREIANIGSGHAATALSQMTGTRINLSVPRLRLVSGENLSGIVSGGDDLVAAVLIRVLGAIPGRTLFVLRRGSALRLADILLGRAEGTSQLFGDMERSALMEAGEHPRQRLSECALELHGRRPAAIGAGAGDRPLPGSAVDGARDHHGRLRLRLQHRDGALAGERRIRGTRSVHSSAGRRDSGRDPARRGSGPELILPSHALRRPSARSERDLRTFRSFAQRIDAADAGAHNNLGVFYFSKEMFEEAANQFQRALEIDPKMQVAQRNLEIVFYGTGLFDRRVADLMERLRENPSDAALRRQLARAYSNNGDLTAAVNELTAVLAADPDDLVTLAQLAEAEKAGGNLQAAQGWVEHALRLDADSAVLRVSLGELLYNQGATADARVQLVRAIELNPTLAEAHHLLAFVYGELGDGARATAAARRAAELNPHFLKAQANLAIDNYNPRSFRELVGERAPRPQSTPGGLLAHYNLAVAFRQKGLFDEALRELDRAAAAGEDPELVRQARAENHVLKGETPHALAIYDELLNGNGASPKLWNERGVCLHHLGDLARAESSYRRALERDSEYAPAWNNLGVVRLHRNDAAGAEAGFAEAVRLHPAFGDASCNRGLLMSRQGNPAAALEAYRHALEIDARQPAAWCGLGRVLMDLRRYADARNAYAHAVETGGDIADAHYGLSFALSHLGEFDGALREAKRALELNPFHTPPRFKLSMELQFEMAEVVAPELDAAAHIESGDHAIADFDFDGDTFENLFSSIAPGAEPVAGEAGYDLAYDFFSKGMLERALAEVRRGVLAGADAAEGALLTAEIYLQQGLEGEALERFDAAIVRLASIPWGARHSRAYLGRARAALKLERLDEALHAAERAVANAPDQGLSELMALGDVLLRRGNTARAAEILRQVQLLSPADPHVLRQLARASRASGDPAAAEQALREACELDPDHAAVHCDLAALYLERERYADAVASARRAFELIPTYVQAALLLGESEWRLGRHHVAVDVLVDVLTADPTLLPGLVLLGRVLLDEGRRADAMHAFRRVLRFDPDRADALFHLGVAAAEERRFRDAIDCWRRAIEADPSGTLAAPARDNIATALEVARVFSTVPGPGRVAQPA